MRVIVFRKDTVNLVFPVRANVSANAVLSTFHAVHARTIRKIRVFFFFFQSIRLLDD